MLITNLLVAGGVVYGGVKTSTGQARRTRVKQPSTLVWQTGQTKPDQVGTPEITTSIVIEDKPGTLTLAERRHNAVAAISLWLAVGGLIFPPLTLISIPLTVYSAVPILEAGARSLYEEGRKSPAN